MYRIKGEKEVLIPDSDEEELNENTRYNTRYELTAEQKTYYIESSGSMHHLNMEKNYYSLLLSFCLVNLSSTMLHLLLKYLNGFIFETVLSEAIADLAGIFLGTFFSWFTGNPIFTFYLGQILTIFGSMAILHRVNEVYEGNHLKNADLPTFRNMQTLVAITKFGLSCTWG